MKKKVYFIIFIIILSLINICIITNADNNDDETYKLPVNLNYDKFEREFWGNESYLFLHRLRMIGIQTPSLEFLKEYYVFIGE